MIHLKENTEGIDCSIKAIQQQLHDSLVKKWGNDIDVYGRAYRNPVDRKFVPEIYDSRTKRYLEMLPDSKKRATIYFIDGTEHINRDEGLMETELKVIFMLDIQSIVGDGRRDDKAQKEAFTSIKDDVYEQFEVESIETTINRVFSGFDTSKILFQDMNQYHVFAIKGKLFYELLNTC